MMTWDWDFDQDYEATLIEWGWIKRPLLKAGISVSGLDRMLKTVWTNTRLEEQLYSESPLLMKLERDTRATGGWVDLGKKPWWRFWG